MKTALIAGATGLIGQSLLKILLSGKHYSKVIALTRRPLHIEHKKLLVLNIDFNRIANFKVEDKVEDVFCCLGTTIKTAGSQEAFTKVDYTYVVQLAQWAKHNKCQQFSVISSVGASVQTTNFYLKTKGNMENAISELALPGIHIFRPSLLLGHRKEFRLGEKISEKLMLLFNPLLGGKLKKYRAIKADSVALAMYNKSQLNRNGTFIYEGDEIK